MPEGTTTITRPSSNGAAPAGRGFKALLKDKRVLYAGGAAVVGIAAYAWWTRGGGGTPEGEPQFDEFGNPIAGPTPGLTEPQVMDSNLVTTVGTGLRTNAEWTQAATDYLEGRGYEAQVVLDAVQKFLRRQPLSPVEASIVGAAVASQGWPPEERPWTIIPASTVTPPGPTPPPAGVKPARPGPITGLRSASTRTTINWVWNAVPGATHYKVQVIAGNSTIRNTTVKAPRAPISALRPGHPYRIYVRAERTGVGTGPYASLVSRTLP